MNRIVFENSENRKDVVLAKIYKDLVRGEYEYLLKSLDGYKDTRIHLKSYFTSDGTEFMFPKVHNTKFLSMTPKLALSIWEKLPDEIKQHAPNVVRFVDYSNERNSYATAGVEGISFYKHMGQHDPQYLFKTYCHEVGHVAERMPPCLAFGFRTKNYG